MSTSLSSPPRVRPPVGDQDPISPPERRNRFLSSASSPRVLLTLILGLGVALGMSQMATPSVTPSTAPATEFSADRAVGVVSTIARTPHPMGTSSHAAVQRYLVGHLKALGLQPRIESLTATLVTENGTIYAGRVHHIVARIPGTANSGAVLLAGHYDSVPTTGGAADCSACVATVLETVHALRAGPPLKNDVIILLADGEEHDTLGSKGVMDQVPWAKEIRLALNTDSMGNHGPAMAFFSSRPSSWLMSQYFSTAPYPLSYSFLMDPFNRTNFGMDLKNYIRDGAMGIESANFLNPQVYHTTLDNPAALDRGTLQHEGSNMLALARLFGNLDLSQSHPGSDAIFFSVTPRHGIVYPAGWAVPLSALVLLLFFGLIVVGLRRRQVSLGGLLVGTGSFIVAFLGATLVLVLAWWAIKTLTPSYQVFQQDAPYGNDLLLVAFAALAAAVMAAVYALLRQRIGALDLTLGATALCVVIALTTSMVLPGISYLFTWPVLGVLLVLWWMAVAGSHPSHHWVHATLLAVSGLLTLLLLTPIVYFLYQLLGRQELIMAAPVRELAVIPAILLSALFLPHLEFLSGTRRWWVPLLALIVSAGFIGAASVTSSFGTSHPRPDSVAYVLNADSGQARWISLGSGTDDWTRTFFPHGAQQTTFEAMPSEQPATAFAALQTSAPRAPIPGPRATVLSERSTATGRLLELQITSPRGAPNLEIQARTAGRFLSASIDGRSVNLVTSGKRSGRLRLEYYGLPSSGARLAVHVSPGAGVLLILTDRSNGLPRIPGTTIAPRPPDTIPSMVEMRDPTIVTKTLWLPA